MSLSVVQLQIYLADRHSRLEAERRALESENCERGEKHRDVLDQWSIKRSNVQLPIAAQGRPLHFLFVEQEL